MVASPTGPVSSSAAASPRRRGGATPNPDPYARFKATRLRSIRDDDVRLILSVLFSVFFGVLMVVGIVSAVWGRNWGAAKDIVRLLLTPVTGLLGTVMGFYFGTKAERP